MELRIGELELVDELARGGLVVLGVDADDLEVLGAVLSVEALERGRLVAARRALRFAAHARDHWREPGAVHGMV